MAVTAIDIVEVIVQRLRAANLSISGNIYRNQRPINSEQEDIVVNSLPVNNSSLQQAVANVNIHPAIKSFKVNDVINSTFDAARLNVVVKQVKAVLSDVWGADHNYDIQQEGLIQDEGFYNIRINFYSENFKIE